MAPIIIYSSLPEGWGVLGLALAMSHNLNREVVVRPLAALQPKPRPVVGQEGGRPSC
jgi:hypothetical protein